MVRTTYCRPIDAMARATCSGSRTSTAPRGLPVVTAQKRQPRVHVSPSSITVAVPSRQHSPTLGQRASSQTVCRSRARKVDFSLWYASPPGARTRSQGGLGAKAGLVLSALTPAVLAPRAPRVARAGGPGAGSAAPGRRIDGHEGAARDGLRRIDGHEGRAALAARARKAVVAAEGGALRVDARDADVKVVVVRLGVGRLHHQ